MGVTVVASGGEGWVPGVDAGVDNADQNAFTFCAYAAGGGAIPNGGGADPGRAGIGLYFKHAFPLYEFYIAQFGDDGRFGGGHFGGVTADRGFVFEQDVQGTADCGVGIGNGGRATAVQICQIRFACRRVGVYLRTAAGG